MTTPTTIVELRTTLLQVPWRSSPPAAGILAPGPREIFVLEIETQGGLVGMSYLMPLHGGLHTLDERRDGVRVTAHHLGQFALRDALGVGLDETPHGCELVGGCSAMSNAPAESLIESIPRPTKQRRQAAAVRRINRRGES